MKRFNRSSYGPALFYYILTRTLNVASIKKNKERKEKRESAAFLVAINCWCQCQCLQLLLFFSRRWVYFLVYHFLSFVQPNARRRKRNDYINKTLLDAKNIIYVMSTPPKNRPKNFVTSALSHNLGVEDLKYYNGSVTHPILTLFQCNVFINLVVYVSFRPTCFFYIL